MTKRLRAVAFAIAAAVLLSAHVGSPNVVFDGAAGPYGVRVIVRPPDVVPGLAEVVVKVNAADVNGVRLRPVFWRAGSKGAPQGDEATRVGGRRDLYSGQLWLMSRGAYSVYVTVNGSRGPGTAIVPVNAFATGRLALPKELGVVLAALGLFLVAGLITIVRAAAGDSLLAPGETLDGRRRRRANMVAAVATPVLALLIFGGAKWWSAVDADYQRTMFRPPAALSKILVDDRHRTLLLDVRDTARFHAIFSPVAPDHGKMMHLFLISVGDMRTFAHLHPTETDSLHFVGEIPWIAAGRYRLFGDLTLENGATLTASTVIDVPALAGAVAPSDSDDSWTSSSGAAVVGQTRFMALGRGYTMSWESDTNVAAHQPVDLHFIVRDSVGTVVSLQSYLGMTAHAVVMRDDGSVFIHLHPMGTVSTTAQQVFALRDRGDTTAKGRLRTEELHADPMPTMTMSGDFTIPYEFPKSGRYRIWVQVKPGRDVLTGTFDLTVR